MVFVIQVPDNVHVNHNSMASIVTVAEMVISTIQTVNVSLMFVYIK